MLRNKLRYLVFLAAVGVLSVLYNTYYMGIIFLTVLMLPFLMFGLLSYFYGSIKAEILSSAHIAGKGETIPVTVQIHNPTIFPISDVKLYLTYQNTFSEQKHKKELLVSVDARTRTSVTCTLTSEYAGNLVITLKAIRIYDYLKLFSLKRKLSGEVKAAVLPNYYELTENDLINHMANVTESDNYSPYKYGDDPSEVFSIREYREGDRQQRIHWKLSRKQGQLMIKEFSDPLNCSVLLLVDLCVPKGVNGLYFADAVLECALSLSYTFLLEKQLHYFAWYDARHGGCRRVRVEKEKDLYEAVDGLLQAMLYSKEDTLTAYLAEHPKEQYTDLYYITGELSEERIELLSAIKSQARQLIYISNAEQNELLEEMLHKSEEMGTNIWPVDFADIHKDLELLSTG